ncbi:MAG: translation elongation factor Ts [Candidatus Yanofskybacteria bacterium RIFCSPHIGHO2_01_FULL_42_12]|uniref:Elongation factor Ts n=1 Tax=Candidatus Yanofskybacteria bacterium RIFCSPLOWO2_01_FULL_42_49 TaxID=1802694 RepID=A0A1F8GD26_9BACT|nr:MAG: translation elongation factor Ts [Candidatus Yanofskybacteria bacterium RIFCSPHIGHO2_01_FULL_42_12]OGN22646.1 MAG: translation elongation factor Ts [Candidatus Yanofskybacteria bacterium RIFCSPLOWO2_01_FULL_42_49]
MAQIDLENIKNLRDATGLSFAQIKKALDEAGGDKARAMEVLKAHGIAVAEKKSSRQVKEGIVDSYIHSTKKLGILIEVLCETDFVARNSEFQKLTHDLAMHIAATKPGTVEDLLSQPFIKDQDVTVKELINQFIAKLGENIQVGRFEIFEI